MTKPKSPRFFSAIAPKHVAVFTLMFAAFAGSWWALRPASPETELLRRRGERSKASKVEPADRTHLPNGEPPDGPGVDPDGSPRPSARPAPPPGRRPRTGAVP